MHTIRKPRVFLSHSKKDIEFIRRLESDLRSCQCEPWIDEIEIRHGKPWLDEIFAAGIPSCEVLLCYITADSVESNMVKQEIDARLLERLQNDRVTLLLYVDSDDSRSRLRLDLQRLQAPVLNAANYSVMLPRVVAAVWRSYAEHFAIVAAQSEKVKRLEAEIRVKELESNLSKDIFTTREVSEFSIAWARINSEVDLQASLTKKELRAIGGMPVLGERTNPTPENTIQANFYLHIGNLFRSTVANQKFQPTSSLIYDAVLHDVFVLLNFKEADYQIELKLPIDFESELLRFGFVERQPMPPVSNEKQYASMFRPKFRVVFTSKFDRFVYWIERSFGQWEKGKSVVRARE